MISINLSHLNSKINAKRAHD